MGRCGIVRVGTTIEETDSAAVDTPETSVLSVTGGLINGRTYEVEAAFTYDPSVAGDVFDWRIRLTDTAGAQRQRTRIPTNFGVDLQPGRLKATFTATTAGPQTFVLTVERLSGTGTVTRRGTSTAPALMWIDRIR